jgi:hypothetical protein
MARYKKSNKLSIKNIYFVTVLFKKTGAAWKGIQTAPLKKQSLETTWSFV